MNPGSIARETGHPVSLEEFLSQFETLSRERGELAARLTESLHESAALRSEIHSLRTQADSRLDSLLVTKERLMREEFERKYQDLVVEVRRERGKSAETIADLKKQLSNCICRRPSKEQAFWNSVAQRSK